MFRLFNRPISTRRKDRTFLPWFEVLEDRTVPSTLTVTTALDDGSAGTLRSVLASAHRGDTIVFNAQLKGDTITLAAANGQLNVGVTVTINGLGAGNLAISGGGTSRVFDIAGAVRVTIANLTITGGKELVTAAGDGGGAILNPAGATVTLNNCVLNDNQAVAVVNGLDVLGGAVLNKGSLTIQNCTFSGNEATGGGSNSFFGGSAGGAIDNYEGGTLTINSSTFVNNEAITVGGGFEAATGGAIESDAGVVNKHISTVVISNSTFTNNVVTGGADVIGNGGAIDNQSATPSTPNLAVMTLTNCTISGNRSVGGGGGDGVTSNDSEGLGGGVMNGAGILTVQSCQIVGNEAVGGNDALLSTNDPLAGSAFGGGIENNLNSILKIVNSLIAGNVAQGGSNGSGPGGDGVGGGISNTPHATMTMTNCTVLGNTAIAGQGGPGTNSALGAVPAGFGFGGGVDTSRGSHATITGSTIANNRAVGGDGGTGNAGGAGLGGGLAVAFGTFFPLDPPDSSMLVLNNTLVLGNVAQGGAGGTGASGGAGFGGGLYINASGLPIKAGGLPIKVHAATASHSTIEGNLALGGSGGQGVGGGVYELGTFADIASIIALNLASTSQNDIGP